jgi:hypothetical protein
LPDVSARVNLSRAQIDRELTWITLTQNCALYYAQHKTQTDPPRFRKIRAAARKRTLLGDSPRTTMAGVCRRDRQRPLSDLGQREAKENIVKMIVCVSSKSGDSAHLLDYLFTSLHGRRQVSLAHWWFETHSGTAL